MILYLYDLELRHLAHVFVNVDRRSLYACVCMSEMCYNSQHATKAILKEIQRILAPMYIYT
jgi:hypothetical protein